MAVSPYTPPAALLTATADIQGAAVPASTKRIIKSATVTNTTAAPIPLSAYLVPSAAAAAAANCMISARAIAAGESYPCFELIGQGLDAGGFLAALGAGLTFKYTAVDIV
jgi:hypothetical protein